MAIVVPNVSDILMLKYVLGKLALDGTPTPDGNERKLHLYTNNLVPSKTTVLANLTEAVDDGYAVKTLNGDDWTFTTVDNVNKAVYAEQTFIFNDSTIVYGYYVTTSDGDLLWVERFFNGPYELPDGGGEIGVTPFLTFN